MAAERMVHELRCLNAGCRRKLAEVDEPYTRIQMVCPRCKRLNTFFGSLWTRSEPTATAAIVVR